MSLKVVCVVDKVGTALDRLAKGVAKYHDNIEYVVCDVHPKRPDPDQLDRFVTEAYDADIIDWQYYRTAEMLRTNIDWLADKKHILTHNNPYAIEEADWNNYDVNVGNNQYIYKRLGQITQTPVEYIPLTVDTDFWTYNLNWEANKKVIMVANRIEGKKGILPVAIACGDLNLRLILVGAISDRDYFEAIMATGVVEYHQQVSDEKLRDLYHQSTLHVCNSVDNFESGTLPILEAMLCGVPVMSRPVGHVPDLSNGENIALYEGDNEDVIAITNRIEEIMADKKYLNQLRENGWNTAKSRSFERRAYMYQKLYRGVMWPNETPVSIVVPVYDKPEVQRLCFNAISNQTYKNIELVVCDDGGIWDDLETGGVYVTSDNYSVVKDFAKTVNFPVRYIGTAESQYDYGLARARNIGTIEATGEIIVYCDQRMIMETNAVEEFVKYLKPKHWLYGNKGSKKEFVENFSCVYRQDVINAGMFCERMDAYGGLSQETRTRIRNQGVQTEFVESAKALAKGKSSNRNRKRAEIIKMKSRLWKMGLE